MAFFPCIFFCENNQLYFTGKHMNLSKLNTMGKADVIIKRARDRQYFYEVCLKMFSVCSNKGLRLIVENPYNVEHYLHNNFPYAPVLIDRNRTLRGDFFNKPTQYWFVNCTPTSGATYQQPKEHRAVTHSKKGAKAGLCSEERSMISPDYARNFICDFLIGKQQTNTIPTLF